MRKRVGFGIAAAVAVGVGALAFVARPGEPTTARGHAVEACDGVRGFEALVRRDAPADEVFAELDGAIASARRATNGDAGYRPLLSGLEALRFSLESDDAEAADTGIGVVRAACAEV